ncbi:bifunctional acetate--CoA ligase family protein/GNAT family N-acetyltransferase [Thalassospira marina]|uniref:GNAT family N-acetyltransferase n=1 Tax=Thalassospira marina TaxID=2048283 RepID=A0ABN5FJB8_9PROT|nr:bifunctional acetate--CoA ligase family protein/GNAT family N-acetyltransferase [Thalassospira marina]AUG52834.1 GNAT family N-acetyltransferase [Thalassospira marina]
MSTVNLEHLFKPSSVAVIGASNRPHSVGQVIMRNLLAGGFDGPIMPVNPRNQSIGGVLAYPDVESLPVVPEMAVICVPPQAVVPVMECLDQKGCKAAIVLTAGLGSTPYDETRSVKQAMLETAARNKMRLLGPNCLGLMVPGIGLNASFSHQSIEKGKIAFVSQSGALCTAVLDWAAARGVGFSHFISLGECDDVDFGDVIDYLGSDPETRAIMLYIESIHERRSFISAARAASRNKPILCIKSGRFAEGAAAAASHTGALAGADDVFDAAIKRAGVLRVYTVSEMFSAAETLSRMRPFKGDKLGIITNGGGIGVLAVDSLIEQHGQLAHLEEGTIDSLNKVLPDTWSHANPIDIIGDAPGERYAGAIEQVLKDPNIDSLLVMHAPTAITDPVEVARGVIDAIKNTRKNILTNWVGEATVTEARKLFYAAGIPTYRTPENAVTAFQHMVNYRKLQDLLMETPPSVPQDFTPETDKARQIIHSAIHSGRTMLTEPEAKQVLECYGINTVKTISVENVAGAVSTAKEIGFPVALKILSDDISHKSDVGGVVLNLESAEEVEHAAEKMLKNIGDQFPDARLRGFTVQQMVTRRNARELIVGMTTDPIFGPVILFGHGGVEVEVVRDRAMALPPLNMKLARELVEGTRIYNLLKGYRDVPPVNLEELFMTLVRLSQLVVHLGEVVELDMNPLLIDQKGVIALDARIKVTPKVESDDKRLAIHPYPRHLKQEIVLEDGTQYMLRPIKPEDEPAHYAFMSKLTPEDIHFRFFGSVRELPHSEMARQTQLDYDRAMAFVATVPDGTTGGDIHGIVQVAIDPNNEYAEYAIMVRSDIKGRGLGRILMEKMIEFCRAKGVETFIGQVLPTNRRMLTLCEKLGFTRKYLEDEEVFEVKLPLTHP